VYIKKILFITTEKNKIMNVKDILMGFPNNGGGNLFPWQITILFTAIQVQCLWF